MHVSVWAKIFIERIEKKLIENVLGGQSQDVSAVCLIKCRVMKGI